MAIYDICKKQRFIVLEIGNSDSLENPSDDEMAVFQTILEFKLDESTKKNLVNHKTLPKTNSQFAQKKNAGWELGDDPFASFPF